MSHRVLLFTVLAWGCLIPLHAEQVQVTSVEGEVLYEANPNAPKAAIKTGQVLGAGIFSAGNNGIAYLRTFAGSELRLAESGTLRFMGTDLPGDAASQGSRPSDFQLLEGKLRVTYRLPSKSRFYRIDLVRGRASVQSGQCVFCMHGSGTYVYVARGLTMLENGAGHASPRDARVWVTGQNPVFGALGPPTTTVLRASGSVGMLDAAGVFQIRPLSAAASGTQNCLLSGFDSDAGGAGVSTHADAGNGPIVSPTQ